MKFLSIISVVIGAVFAISMVQAQDGRACVHDSGCLGTPGPPGTPVKICYCIDKICDCNVK